MHFSGPGMNPHGYYDQSGYEPSPGSTGSAGMHYIDSLLTITLSLHTSHLEII